MWLLVDVETAVDVEQLSTHEMFFVIFVKAGFFFLFKVGSLFDLPVGRWVFGDGMTLVSRWTSSAESASLLDNDRGWAFPRRGFGLSGHCCELAAKIAVALRLAILLGMTKAAKSTGATSID